MFVKHYHTIPPAYGGVSVYVKRLMLSLIKKGYMSGAFKRGKIEGIPTEYSYLLDEFPRHSRSFCILLDIIRLYNIFSKYQIIHSHSTLSTIFGIWIIHKLQDKPIVYTIHNQMIDKEFLYLNILDRYCVRSLARDKNVQFITVNENGKRDLEKRVKLFANAVKVVPAYIPPVEIGSASNYLPRELLYFMDNNNMIILFYAESFDKHNGVDIYGSDIMIDAFCSLKEKYEGLKLIFCISNIKSDRSSLRVLQEKIHKNKLNSDVYWQIGAISEMWPLLKRATVLLRPTSTDGDSIMVREALAFGLPVISSNVTVRPEGCILFKNRDINSLIEKTSSVLDNPYRKTFAQKDRTEEMINIYESVVNG